MKKNIPYRIQLSQEQVPSQWYNLRADMPVSHDPYLHPGTLKPLVAEDLYPIFCKKLVEQELDETTRFFDIPDEVREIYKVYRPAPLCRAYNLEKKLGTPARIYYKYEGNNTSGSHKLNSAVAQAYYAKEQGLKGLTTETGAGQWGTALAEACNYFDLPLIVYMVKVSSEQKPYRKAVMETFNASVVPSPSETTDIGKKILAENPGTGGSLGCAISEAIETAAKTEGYRYVLGSVMNQVLLHQSIIGLEAYEALEMVDEYPDIVIGCAGGGSNLGGLIAPFMRDKLTGKANPRIVAVEPASCPSFTRGKFAYDFCDTGKVTPFAKMYTVGGGFIPSPSHAGGLRFHGMSPVLSKLYHDGHMEAVAREQSKVFEAAVQFAKYETILPAPESAHAIYEAMEEAKRCKETGEEKVILFGLSGTGYFDMSAYMSYKNGTMTDFIPTDEDLERSFATLPKVQ
ncbi:MAG: TrpB-like pyridoxal phosphate-dependent enzyme [Oscillospiraceae bacterium]|nr:TrpB-like pyridoxal phosphate-dependent enzyme [Oscillospiraceae bacterium]